MGSGAVLGLAPAPEYTFLIYVSPVGNYFKVYYLYCLILVMHKLNQVSSSLAKQEGYVSYIERFYWPYVYNCHKLVFNEDVCCFVPYEISNHS